MFTLSTVITAVYVPTANPFAGLTVKLLEVPAVILARLVTDKTKLLLLADTVSVPVAAVPGFALR